jgi:urease accessory protein UreH
MAIQLVNDALRTGQLFLPRDSRCAQDALRLEWEVKKNGKKVVSDRFHSDALDMLVYAYRHSRAYREQPIEERPETGTTKWQEEKLLQAAIDRDRAKSDPDYAEDLAWAKVLEQDE